MRYQTPSYPPLPSEVLTMFLAWLTTRKESLSLGASHEVPAAIEACRLFCEANAFAGPRRGFENLLSFPEAGPAPGLTPHEVSSLRGE